jgi:uncharacterized membrane protein YhaH (DUF805 family)
MRRKSYWISLITFLFITGCLYLIGYLFNIEWLQFRFYKDDPSKNVFSEGSSLIPFIIGFIFSLIVERKYKLKEQS